MGFDIYGNRLLPGHCEVHPYVHEEFPCSICMAERSTQARQPDGPLCGICGKFEACADSCGVPVCSEACDHEAQRRHNEVETLRAELAAERARGDAAVAEAAEAWRQVHLLKAETSGPDGFATWKDAATDERVRRVKAEQEAAKLRADAERWRALREMDGGEIYALLGDCDGIHTEQADAAIDEVIEKENSND